MTQQQFLRALSRKLRGVPAPEREEALRYYKEYLQEAALDPQADVTPLVGTPEECARGILADSLIRKEQSANVKSGWESFWLVVLGIFAAPVALPLAIAALVLVIVVFAVLTAFFAAGLGLAGGGVGMLVMTFFAPSAAQGLIVAGYGLLMISVGVLMVIGTAVLWALVVRGMASLLRRKGAKHEEGH